MRALAEIDWCPEEWRDPEFTRFNECLERSLRDAKRAVLNGQLEGAAADGETVFEVEDPKLGLDAFGLCGIVLGLPDDEASFDYPDYELRGIESSPVALARLVRELKPAVAAMQEQSTGLGFAGEADCLERCERLLTEASLRLQDTGWELGQEGRLKRQPRPKGGRPKQYLTKIIERLYDYISEELQLHGNTTEVQDKIREILERIFSASETDRKRIKKAIDNHLQASAGPKCQP